MPGCFTGISINSPISSLILGVPAITMSRLFRNSTHFIDSTGLTYTNFLRNPGPHPFQICNRIPKRWCWLFFWGGGLTTTNLGGCFFNLTVTEPFRVFVGKLHQKPPRQRPWRDLQNRIPTMGPWNRTCGFCRGHIQRNGFWQQWQWRSTFWKKRETTFCCDQVMFWYYHVLWLIVYELFNTAAIASSGRQWVCHAIIRPILLGCIKSTSLHRCFMYISCCWNEAWLSINQEFHNIHWCGWLVVSQSDRNRCCQHRHRLSCLRMLSIVVFFHQARFHLADASPSNLFISAQWPASCMGWIFKMKVYRKSAKFIYTLQLHLRHLRHLERK